MSKLAVSGAEAVEPARTVTINVPSDAASEKRARIYTTKQMGDACEMLVAANLTLAGIPALKVPDNWPGYDVVAQRADGSTPLRISVKSRTFKSTGSDFVKYDDSDQFDWLAVVLIYPDDKRRRFYLLPREVADAIALKDGATAKTRERYWPLSKVEAALELWEDNFSLTDRLP